MRKLTTLVIAVLSLSVSAQHSISIVGSGDDSKVRLVEFADDHKKTTLYNPISEVDALALKDSLSAVYIKIDSSLDDLLASYVALVEMTETDLKTFKRMRRKVERQIERRDAQ